MFQRSPADPSCPAISPPCMCLTYCAEPMAEETARRAAAVLGGRVFSASSLEAAAGLALSRGFDLAILEGEPAVVLAAAGRLRSLAELAGGGAIVALVRVVDERFREAAALAGVDGLVETGRADQELSGVVRLLWPKGHAAAATSPVAAPGAGALIELKPRP